MAEMVSNSNQVIAVVDPSMRVRWMSKSSDAYGIDAVGKLITDVIHPEDLERAVQAFDGEAQRDGFEPSLMANSIVPVRLITDSGVVPFDTNGRWATDDQGNTWLISTMHDVTTRYASDQALRKLAAGSDEQESIRAVIAATRDYRGVTGTQVVWKIDGVTKTLGDLGSYVPTIVDIWGDLTTVDAPGIPISLSDSDWGFALPVTAGTQQLGALAMWGIGPSPNLAFVAASIGPLLDLTALALQRAREHADLERRATTDQVTGLMNRHAFFGALDRNVTNSAVMYLDLDEFKAVNDRFGHTLGDRLLSVVSRRLQDAVGGDEVVGRVGGDEFAVLCSDVSPTEVQAVADRIVGALNQTFVIDGNHIANGASVGVAYSDRPMSGRLLLDQADRALLEAKAQGKGRSVVLM